MFASLKNKIKEETGNDVCAPHSTYSTFRRSSSILSNLNDNDNEMNSNITLPASHSNGIPLNNNQHRFSAIVSPIDQLNGVINKKNDEIIQLIEKLNDSETKFTKLSNDYDELLDVKNGLEKRTNTLEESLKTTQEQRELIHSEQDKIQNLQAQEISKLKNLLHFREQEAIDRLATIKQKDNQLEQLQLENARLRNYEENFENIQDELEKVRHSAQIEKNNLTASLASMEEQNRHLKSKLQIYEEGRINFSANQSNDEKIQTLLRERRMLEQRLEEAHLHLSDIKSSWSAQNMALETQVDRLSRQVAAETTEKRKALTAHDELAEKCKKLEFQLEKAQTDIEQRDQKIKLMSEENDDLSSSYQEYKEQHEEEVTFLRSKVSKSTSEIEDLKCSLEASTERLNAQTDDVDKITKSLNSRIDTLQQNLQEAQDDLEKERKEKNSVLLKNVEMSQNEERLKQQLRDETHEINEMSETIQHLTEQRDELEERLSDFQQQIENIDELKNEISEKNKTIKMMSQRLADMKKTLQNELKSGASESVNASTTSMNGTSVENKEPVANEIDQGVNNNNNLTSNIVMDDVNFKYLKHVILKFLTSREVEARHLVRAIGTLLNLSNEEEQLLHETLNFKIGWFGSRSASDSKRNRHHKLLSIPSLHS